MPRYKVVWTQIRKVHEECDLEIEADDLEKAQAEADRLYDHWRVDPWIEQDSELIDILTDIKEIAADETAPVLTQADIDAVENAPAEEPDDDCQDEQPLFVNHYRCPCCTHEWTDKWSATCDDDCQSCGMRHISPYKSEDADDADSPDETVPA